MPANYSIKRNSLSSKWGVWSVESTASSPVENLVAEFKKQAQAEIYKEKVEAGESHAAVIALINTKPARSKNGGGIFGKMFKRGSAASEMPARQTVTNAVIEIQPRQATGESVATENEATEEVPAPAKRVSKVAAPSRFQFIEPSARPAPVAKVKAEPAATPSFKLDDEVTVKGLAEDQIETVPEPVIEPAAPGIKATVEDEPFASMVKKEPEAIVEDIAEPEERVIEPVPAMQQSESEPEGDVDENGVLVDWTFSPPPDVTPEEVHASSQDAIQAEAEQLESPAEPELTRTEVTNPVISTETDRQEKPVSVQPTPEQPETTVSTIAGDADSRMTVDICVSKALKDSAVGNPKVSDKKYNSIASKEYTEVSKAFASGNSQEHLREELTHLAAVCLAWADAIGKRQASDAEEQAA